jgi:hypothetical protein
MERTASPFLDEDPSAAEPAITTTGETATGAARPSGAIDPVANQAGAAAVGPPAPSARATGVGTVDQTRPPVVTPHDAPKVRPPVEAKRPKIKSEYW